MVTKTTPHSCPNCGAADAVAYCPHCGQQQRAGAFSLRDWAGEVIDDLFLVNGRLLRHDHRLRHGLPPHAQRVVPSRAGQDLRAVPEQIGPDAVEVEARAEMVAVRVQHPDADAGVIAQLAVRTGQFLEHRGVDGVAAGGAQLHPRVPRSGTDAAETPRSRQRKAPGNPKITGRFKWSRRESNPRPQPDPSGRLRACSTVPVFSSDQSAGRPPLTDQLRVFSSTLGEATRADQPDLSTLPTPPRGTAAKETGA
jgi:hypothetical protein